MFGRGARDGGGTCRCAKTSAGSSSFGDRCEHVAVPAALDAIAARAPLGVGRWHYERVDFRGAADRDATLTFELAYPRSPAAAPAIFASRGFRR